MPAKQEALFPVDGQPRRTVFTPEGASAILDAYDAMIRRMGAGAGRAAEMGVRTVIFDRHTIAHQLGARAVPELAASQALFEMPEPEIVL